MSSFNDYFHKNLGQNVRKFRTERGITQEKLAEILNLNDKYFGHIERCERQMSHKVAVQLMELWHISPSEFYSFERPFDWNNN